MYKEDEKEMHLLIWNAR